MRLWHSKLIPLLDNKRLADVHMSCCNLRGKGWGKKNVSINYLYDDPLGEEALVVYHLHVLAEMRRRSFNYYHEWTGPTYCGKNRESRQMNTRAYVAACQREVPLLGHTPDLFLNDLETLVQRGLDITYTIMEGDRKSVV